ncbi:MAG: 4a-hydroxytetrahydrobiopterin dehydratase [Cyanobacteria bacterium J06641_5]
MPNSRLVVSTLLAAVIVVPALACTQASVLEGPSSSETSAQTALAADDLKQWGNDGKRLFSTCEFGSEAEIPAFIEDLKIVADTLKHDPDLAQDGTRLEIVTTTYDTGGLTDLDFSLARAADRLLVERNAQCQPQLLVQ